MGGIGSGKRKAVNVTTDTPPVKVDKSAANAMTTEHIVTAVDAEREAMYAEINAGQEPVSETPPADGEPATAAVKTEDVVDLEKIAEAPPIKDATTEKEYKVEDKGEEKKKDEHKTVPLDALHEEREKRKSAQSRAKELEAEKERLSSQLREVLETNRTLTQKPADDNAYQTDEAKEIAILKSQIAALTQDSQQRNVQAQNSEAMTRQHKVNEMVTKTSLELDAEGFPGLDFMLPKVTEELSRMVREDPDNIIYDNPDGWKKIYKETVFPKLRGMVAGKNKEDAFAAKNDAKAKANLAGSSGKVVPSAEVKEDTWTYDDYIAHRKKTSADG